MNSEYYPIPKKKKNSQSGHGHAVPVPVATSALRGAPALFVDPMEDLQNDILKVLQGFESEILII